MCEESNANFSGIQMKTYIVYVDGAEMSKLIKASNHNKAEAKAQALSNTGKFSIFIVFPVWVHHTH